MNCLIENTDYFIKDGILTFNDRIEIIPPYSFQNNNSFYKVIIPKNVRLIGEYAFDSNTELEFVNFNDSKSLEEIDRFAFSKCSLKEIILPDSVFYLGEGAFNDTCRNSKEIVLSKNIKIIPPKCFCACRAEELIIPSSVEIVGKGAFSYARIKKLVIPSSVKILDYWAGDGIEVLDARKFTGYSYGRKDCSKKKNLLINRDAYYEETDDNIKTLFPIRHKLKELTKNNCSKDSNNVLTINEGVELIPSGAFRNSTIRNVIFPSTLKVIEPYAFSNSKVISLKFPKTIESIGSRAFSDCKQLKEVEFNDGLLVINDGAFKNTALTEVELPDTLLLLGYDVFDTLDNNIKVKFNPKGNAIVYTSNNHLVSVHPNDYNESCVILNDEYSRLDLNDNARKNKYKKDILLKYNLGNTLDRKFRTLEESELLSRLILDKINEKDFTNKSIVKYLIKEGADLDYISSNNKVLLHQLYETKEFELIIEFIKYGVNIDVCSSDKTTLLMIAIKEKDYTLINILVESGSCLNIENIEGYTPLMYAVLSKDEETIRYLISSGANPNYTNKNGVSAETIARDNEIDSIISIFEKKTESIVIDKEEDIQSDINKLLQLLK